MIPRVRLKYVQGLEAAHEDLRLPRDVDLTTDGQALIASSAASGRPLLKIPPPAIGRIEVEPRAGPTSAANKVRAGLSGSGNVLVLQIRPAPGVPAAAVDQPIVFASPNDKDVGTRLEPVKNLLIPRTREEMARLARGERRLQVYFAVGFVALVMVVLALVVAFFLLVAAPNPRQGSVLPARVPAHLSAQPSA